MTSTDNNTHMILNFIGKDVFLSESVGDKKRKILAYEKCLSEIKERVDLEVEASVNDFWRGKVE